MAKHMWKRKQCIRNKAQETLGRLHEEKDGVAIVEYALLIAGITVAVMLIVFSIGDAIKNLFTEVENTMLE